ncbi:glutamine amidotransferase, SNO family domain-containing protein [Neospora caninum Liverpool]|uniref:glutaminase n=1 Tax=Neospora caninum (strain Liverpool) TaxID=572307 RepID=F0VFR2_NEOCL|nr:glutamine amidotransferase, SNO family domain-containing protein [Neospora caninum Liverpool]CBZ52556.1 glutamine amidotransferase, SNO family domain-containing protein [Neospora caninum Liverpool]CEL66532.1 TPA: glutamine amidotransferase, SNO family domain-containing protein, putative [Neospora caninum Liverpool]|eukprot:XP_003882588.1 glutamine amidotransferase, SNO family domain-containing protein [Neospora caninum Liverpool]
MGEENAVSVGVLALQGAFFDHIKAFQRLGLGSRLRLVLVKKPADLEALDALVIPGGESTAMRIIAGEQMMSALKAFVHEKKKPVWGTCAGCILLSDAVCTLEASPSSSPSMRFREKESDDGYGDFIGGAAVRTCRNFFGRQADSFEAPLRLAGRLQTAANGLSAICIRAPAILEVSSPEVEILGYIDMPQRNCSVIAAAAHGPVLLTIFHTELTDDTRLHAFFLEQFVFPSLAAGPRSKQLACGTETPAEKMQRDSGSAFAHIARDGDRPPHHLGNRCA